MVSLGFLHHHPIGKMSARSAQAGIRIKLGKLGGCRKKRRTYSAL